MTHIVVRYYADAFSRFAVRSANAHHSNSNELQIQILLSNALRVVLLHHLPHVISWQYTGCFV
jgi:hypothetical protein